MVRKACLTLQVYNKYSPVIYSSIFMVSFLFFFAIYLFSCAGSLLWDVGSNSLTRESNPGPLHWECGVLATGPRQGSPCGFLS